MTPFDSRQDMSGAVTRSVLEIALLETSGRVPDEFVDWDDFHDRLEARTALPLARLRVRRGAMVRHVRPVPAQEPMPIARASTPVRHWWEQAARWSRVTVSASLVASAALVAVIRITPKAGAELPTTGAATPPLEATENTRAAFESAVVGAAATATHYAALMPNAAELLIPLGRGVSQ